MDPPRGRGSRLKSPATYRHLAFIWLIIFNLSGPLVRIQGQWNHRRRDDGAALLRSFPVSPSAPSSKLRLVYLLDATNNICFYFCAGPSPAVHFFKSGARLWRTAGWIIERKPGVVERNEPVILDKLLSKGRERAFSAHRQLLCSS